jgi:hypothetical protein
MAGKSALASGHPYCFHSEYTPNSAKVRVHLKFRVMARSVTGIPRMNLFETAKLFVLFASKEVKKVERH